MSFTTTQSALVASDSSDRLTRTLPDFRAERRGSLPFKKRRLTHGFGPVTPPAIVSITPIPRSYTTHEDDRAAALALLAAASGALTKMVGPCSTVSPPLAPLLALSQAAEVADRRTPSPRPSPHIGVESTPSIKDVTKSSSSQRSAVGPSPVTPINGEFHLSRVVAASAPLSSSSSGGIKPRVHHPPLSSPLPNGCHGRTSRNNSFCRRTPCYNGSCYCKLHYQQYIVAGTRVPVAAVAPTTEISVPSTPTAHQDKRFTGCGDEVRCTATTTRGRACAYISVVDSKYCHLHADYDTNPPPRRGGSSCSSSSKPRPVILATTPTTKSSLTILPRMQGCPGIPDLGSKAYSAAPLKPSAVSMDMTDVRRSPPSVSSDESSHIPPSSSKDSSSQSAAALLSSISSDQWLNRKVVIATGPLANRTGTVEKWGNGWVTVRVRDSLTHNRRSVELHLLTDNEQRGVIPHCVSYEKDAKHDVTDTLDNSSEESQGSRSHSVSFDQNTSAVSEQAGGETVPTAAP